MNPEDRLRQMTRAARDDSPATEREWNGFVRKARRRLYARRAGAAVAAMSLIAVGALGASAFTGQDPVPGREDLKPGQSPTSSPDPEATPTRTVKPPSTVPAVNVPKSEAEQWFLAEERLYWGTTVAGGPLPATMASEDPVAQRAAFWLRNLVAVLPGPVEEAGGTTAIPDGTEVLHVSREDNVLNVDLSSEFEAGGGSLSMQLRVAQIVYTGTQFEGIDSVRILIEGERVESIGGEGFIVAEPLTRRDFQDFAPPIVVESPKPGQEFSGSFEVAGFANVYEATVAIRLESGRNGVVLAETFTTATCGTGCWGDFSEEIRFDVDEPTEARLLVFTHSAEDGSEQDVIHVPVRLVP